MEEINGIKDGKDKVMNDNFTFDSQIIRLELNSWHFDLYVKFNITEILNN